ncbi:MAG: 2-5 ligase [Akkermansiaceae bacterium]|nr:2-5 ligase [Akkermansiaceae bacterium]
MEILRKKGRLEFFKNRASFGTAFQIHAMEQLSLPGLAPPPLSTIFVALMVEKAAARQVVGLGEGLSRGLGLKCKLRPQHILHVTLKYLGSYAEVPWHLVEDAKKHCATAARFARSFEATFDQAMSFNGRPNRHPLVLTGRRRNSDLDRLHRVLAQAFGTGGSKTAGGFLPHVTFGYGPTPFDVLEVEPVRWDVTEILLIRSLVGKTEYQELGRWPLGQ